MSALTSVIPSSNSAFCPIGSTLPRAYDEPHFATCKQIVDRYTNKYYVTDDRARVRAIIDAKRVLAHMAVGFEGNMDTRRREAFQHFLRHTAKCHVAAFLVMLTEEERFQWVNNYELFVAGL